MISNHELFSTKLDALFQKTASKLPGNNLISSVQSGDGSFRWTGVAGTAQDGSYVHEQTPFFIASVDKLMNAALILQLAEDGLINLDLPAADYLPNRIINGLHVYKGKDYSHEITVRHLLTHTSGIADWYEDFPAKGVSLVESIIEEGDRDLSVDEMMDYVRTKLKPNFAPQPIEAFCRATISDNSDKSSKKIPSIKTRYTDTGFMLLCAVLMEVTGERLEDLHQTRIYKPLGMEFTWQLGRTEPASKVNPHLPLVASGKPVEIPKMIRSVWGVYSTCDDMMLFLKALYNGKLFKKQETRALMFEGWHKFGFPTDKAAIRLPGWPIAYSHGTMQFKLPRLFSPLKPMPEVVGHTGSTGCWLFYSPEKDLYFTGAADDVTAGALPFKYVPAMLRCF